MGSWSAMGYGRSPIAQLGGRAAAASQADEISTYTMAVNMLRHPSSVLVSPHPSRTPIVEAVRLVKHELKLQVLVDLHLFCYPTHTNRLNIINAATHKTPPPP